MPSFNIIKVLFVLLGVLGLTACQEAVTRDSTARILAIGDSYMMWNSHKRQSIPHFMELELSSEIIDRSVPGALMMSAGGRVGKGGSGVPSQFVDGNWSWVVVNGGGNDLMFACGCQKCDNLLDRLISQDGTRGQIPNLLYRARQTGAKVVYVGYLRSPGFDTPIEHCKAAGEELDRRVSQFADQHPGIFFASMADVVPYGNKSYHVLDLVHPSPVGSSAVAQRVAQLIRQNGGI